MEKRDYDAVVVGSGPNGLAAAITLQQQGLSTIVIEAKSTVGGGMRTQEMTLPGYKHDICSAIHPLACDSPFFDTLPLARFGLRYIHSPSVAAHPFDDGTALMVERNINDTAVACGDDRDAYMNIIGRMADIWPAIRNDVLAPLRFPQHPFLMSAFARHALTSAASLSKKFRSPQLKALWTGMSAHSILPLNYMATSAFGLVLMAAAHNKGWPLAMGGSSAIADALAGYFISIGGRVQTSMQVTALKELPTAHAVLFDITPRQLLRISGAKLSRGYSTALRKYRYGPGVFKMDWALDGPVPFKAEEAGRAATVHLGESMEDIAGSEQDVWRGRHPEKPFVILSQPSLFDVSRAPSGKHTAWAYCHVPNGSEKDMTDVIEAQVERFAPGFRERILTKHTMNTVQLEDYNHNYCGGDINGGAIDIRQLFARPVLKASPYRTSAKGLYLCSSSTPPGGGVHGMCGFYAARRALKDVFHIDVSL